MRALAVAVVAWSSSVLAGPLPEGTQVVLEDSSLVFVDHGTRVPLFDPRTRSSELAYTKLISASLSSDGTIVVQTENCLMDHDELRRTAVLDHARARAENLRGMQLHLAKKFTDAIPHFASAAKLDPGTPMYATNLLSAQSMAKLLDDADKTLATAGTSAPVWFAWRLAVDSDLANLRGRASTKPFTSAKRTKLAYAALGDVVAASPAGYFAFPEYHGYGMGPTAEDLAVFDANGRELVRVPVIADVDACIEAPEAPVIDFKCTKAQRAHTAANRRAADELLASGGFAAQPIQWVDAPDQDKPVVSPDKKITVKQVDDKLVIARGSATRTVDGVNEVRRVGFSASAVIVEFHVMHGCGGAENSGSSTIVLAVP